MAKQILDIGAAPNDGNGDPLRDAMDKVNDNFNELYTALGGNTVSTIVSNGLIDYTGANKLTFLFTDISDLPAASSYHGMFAHAHNQGAAYFAHAGSWIELANKSELSNITIGSLIDVDTTSSAPTDGQVLKWNNAGSKWVPADDSNAGSVALTDLSVTVASAGTANLAYNANTGAFTYTPPDLSTYLTSVPAQTFASLTSKPTTLSGYGITDAQATLVSATNIKTINGTSLLGSGNITITATDPEYNNGAISNVTGNGSDFFKRELTVNGVRIVGAGSVGGQVAVPDAWLEKVGRMFELFLDKNAAGINETAQRNVIKTLSGDAGTYHATQGPTLQRVARGAGSDYTPNFLTDAGIVSWNLSPLFDSHVANDMVWYLNSTGDGYGDGEIDAQEVIEHVFHTLHMHGLDAVSLKMYPYISADWATGPLYNAMVEAYDGGYWDPAGYGGAAFKTDGDAFEVAAKEYLYLLNFSMFEYTGLWDGDSLAPEWADTVRTSSQIQTNLPLGYALHNTYIAPVISKPSLATINSIFGDGNTPAQDNPALAGASGYVVTSVGGGGIALTDLSVGTEGSASGDGGIAYNNSTGVFTYTPPDLSSYSTFSGAYADLTGKPTIPSSVDDLTDVDITTSAPTDGQALVWDNANSKFIPGTVAAGASTDALSDVTARGAVTNDAVTINNTLTVTSLNSTGLGFATLQSASDISLNAVGDINANSSKITNVLDPVDLQDAATKNYVDTAISNSEPSFTVTAPDAGRYSYTGSGFIAATDNPTLYLYRGFTYHFIINSPGHPFWINSVNGTGTGNAYNNGVTNNGTASGTIAFMVPMDAPSTLYYNCEYHGAMNGTINIV